MNTATVFFVIAFSVKFISNDKNDLMTSAYYASSEILDGWKGLVEKTA